MGGGLVGCGTLSGGPANKSKCYFPIAIIIMLFCFFLLTMASSILAKIICFGFVFVFLSPVKLTHVALKTPVGRSL